MIARHGRGHLTFGRGRAQAPRFDRPNENFHTGAAELAAVVQEIAANSGQALAVPTDVTDAAQVQHMVEQTVDAFGGLHLAWNNAGMLGEFAPLHEATLDVFDSVVSTNLRGVAACMKYEVKAMLAAGVGGAIVNTSSWTAHGAVPGTAGYAASKAALDALMRTVSLEVGASNIRVNNVSPGIIATPMSEAALGDERAMRPFLLHTPLQRIGQPEDVADVVTWLLSDDARYVTGQSILVDGGFTLGGLRPWLSQVIAEYA